jgi:SSS family solute:Na+ symporter
MTSPPVVSFTLVDTLLILLYFAAVVFVGFRAVRRGSESSEDFLLAGRTLTLPLFVATLVSTWYGGILGVGEFSYRYGISNWIVLGVPYYVFALLFALFLARRIRATGHLTIPDKLHASYDKKTALLGGVLTFVLVTPAAYVLMVGILVQLVFGLSLAVSIIVTTIVTVCYLYWGGFRSGVWANVLEFILMFLGFALILPFAYLKLGGWEYITSNVPPLHLSWDGGNSWQYILVWFFIALWTLVDPAFHQRCYAARDGATAQKGILISIVFWFCFDFMTSVAGLYARAALPGLTDPAFSYPLLAERVLPPVAKGLFTIGMLATIMSTLSSLMFISASTIGKDLAGRLHHFSSGSQEEEIIRRWTKVGLVISALFSVVLSLTLPSVVAIWYTIGTAIVPGLLVPLIASYFDSLRISARTAFWAMLLGWGVSTGWLLEGQVSSESGRADYWLGIEPMIPGLLVSLVVWMVGKIQTRFPKSSQR